MLQTACAYITRKRLKSLLIMAIVMVMATLSLVSLGIKSATRQAVKSTFKNISSSFSLQINRRVNQGTPRGGGNLKGADIKKISESKYILSTVKRIGAVGDLVDGDIVKSDPDDGHAFETRENFEKALMVTGVTDSAKETKFVGGTYVLTAGEHLKENDNKHVLVHEELAKQNKWKIGDKIKLKSNIYDADNEKQADNTVEVTIKGLFKGKNNHPATYAVEYYANEIISDLHTAATLYGYTVDNAYYQDATFFVNGEHDLDMVIKSLQNLDIDFDAYNFVKSSDNYPALQASINGVKDLANKMGLFSLVFAALVLTVFLYMTLHARTYEIGIMLALGLGKVRIFGQFLLELVMLSIFSFIGSFFLAKAIGQQVQNMVLQHVNSSVSQQLEQAASSMSLGGGAEVDNFNTTLRSLTLTITGQDFLIVVLGGLLVILLALCIASYRILKQTPKDLLSKLV